MYSFSSEDTLTVDKFGNDGFFVDIGAGDGSTWSNSKLVAEIGWRGVCIECDEVKLNRLRSLYEGNKNVKVADVVVNTSNINDVLNGNDVPESPELISVDIDGIDSWIVCEILKYRKPKWLIVEINHYIKPPIRFCVNKNDDWIWGRNAVFGASVQHYCDILTPNGYSLIHILVGNAIFSSIDKPSGSASEIWEREAVPLMVACNGEHAIPNSWGGIEDVIKIMGGKTDIYSISRSRLFK